MRFIVFIFASLAGTNNARDIQKGEVLKAQRSPHAMREGRRVAARLLMGFNQAAGSLGSAAGPSTSTAPLVRTSPVGLSRSSASLLRASPVGMLASKPTTGPDIFPFPAQVVDVISQHLSLSDCSYVDLPIDMGQRILDSEFFQEKLVHPLSKFEIRKQALSWRRSSAAVAERSLLNVLNAYMTTDADLPDQLDLHDEEQSMMKDKRIELRPGLGCYELQWEGEALFVLFYERDRKSGRGVAVFVHGQGRQAHLQSFCNLPDFKPEAVEKKIDVFVGCVQPHKGEFSWERSEPTSGRDLDTVLLPARMKNYVDYDMSSFLAEGRLAFFRQHGIPYKRSYLFYGVPGAGKSSMIRALATKFDRRLCILQPSGAAWNDYLLFKAVQSAPKRAMIVFEDADSLFSESRQNTAQSGVTFSGLLNVLDGVHCKDGCIFILTTNFRERLDKALTREGRIDIEVPFDYIKPAEVVSMFQQFYPSPYDAGRAGEFEAALRAALGEERYQTVSPAALQLYFAKHFDKSAEQVIRNVGILANLG